MFFSISEFMLDTHYVAKFPMLLPLAVCQKEDRSFDNGDLRKKLMKGTGFVSYQGYRPDEY